MATKTITALCTFCGKRDKDVAKLIAGPGVFICNECVSLCNDILGQDAPVEPDSIPKWFDMSDDQILDFLPKIASTVTQVEDGLNEWVQRLRSRGVSWARIGEALGMARQSAWERFSSER